MVGRLLANSHNRANASFGGDDLTDANLPPPSTLAAQLVRNHVETARGVQQTDTTATFRQLLQELLNKNSAPESDLEVNHKLIKVVVEAGLDVLFQDDPFPQWDFLLPQAVDSLAVIQSTIQTQPDILFHHASPSNPEQHPHLLLWLFPKLLMVAKHSKGDQLQGPLASLLSSLVMSLTKTLDLWPHAKALLQMLRDCITDILLLLQDSRAFSKPSSQVPPVLLPPARSTFGAWPTPKNSVALTLGHQLSINDALSATRIQLLLISALRNIATAKFTLTRLQTSTFPLHKWIFDSVTSMNRILFQNKSWFEQQLFFSQFALQVVRLQTFVLNGPSDPTARNRVAYMLSSVCECCSRLIMYEGRSPLDVGLQQELASTINHMVDCYAADYAYIIEEFLLPSVGAFARDTSKFEATSEPLRQVAEKCSKMHDMNNQITERTDTIMSDHDLQTHIETPVLPTQPSSQFLAHPKSLRAGLHNACSPTPKVSNVHSGDPYQTLRRKVAILMGKGDTNGRQNDAVTCYASMSEDQQTMFWQIVRSCACAATNNLHSGKCSVCDGDHRLRQEPDRNTWEDNDRAEDWTEMFLMLTELFESQDLQLSNRHRVLAILAVRSIVLHNRDPTYLDLGNSFLAEWCLKYLHSSSRELRLAAGRTLAAFLREGLPVELRNKNRQLALNFLRALSTKDIVGQHETLILAWGRVAVVCGEKELNLALLRLVDYLGHPNSLVCSLAYSELEDIAETLSLSPQTLLKPFYRSIAVAVIQDLTTKPQKAQQLSEFLGMSVSHFLLLTQKDTVPFLVLTRKKDVLQRVASARSANTSIQDMCLQPPANLAAVISTLLYQPSSDVEGNATRCLAEIAPGFQSSDLGSLARSNPVLIACEMLKTAGDEDELNAPKAQQAIQIFIMLVEGKPSHSKQNAKANRVVVGFFEAHILGIMTEFSNSIDNSLSLSSSEKLRCVRAIEQMIILAKSKVSVALPQIRACLQSAIDQPKLQESALSAWLTLVAVLEGDDFADMVDHTFALVAQHWNGLSSSLQMNIHDTISEMVKTHSNVIREKLMTIPSLASIPLMSKIGLEIQRLKKDERPDVHLRAFAKRLHDENVAIVTQGLLELVPWLGENQGFVHEAAVSEQPKAAIADVMRALLDVCTRYANHDSTVVDLSAQCIGIIGCLDANSVEMSSSKRQVLVLSNFEKASEVINWVAIMLEDVLVPAFRSSTNARDQGFLAYVMQELVRFCGFNEAATARLRPSQAGPAYNRWTEMTESVRNTLTPFLSSRYLLKISSEQPGKRDYPVFVAGKCHSTWLREWAYDMMWRGKGDNAEMVFPILARIINRHDISIASFLLPYAALNIVLGGTVQEAKDVGVEMLTVLSTESVVESERVSLRQCSENVFAVLDYMSKWLQEKKRTMASYRTAAIRAGHPISEMEEVKDVGQIESVESVIRSIPADIIAQRAMECGSYARALFHWESHIREQSQRQEKQDAKEHDAMFQRLHSIYSQIDEPDGLDGISAHLNILSPEQQAYQHQRTGRWSAAQSWYELELIKKPSDTNRQIDLLSCLRESGQYDQVLRYASYYNSNPSQAEKNPLLSYITEACWTTERFDTLKEVLAGLPEENQSEFNVGVAKVLLAMQEKNQDEVSNTINNLRNSVVKGVTSVSGSSLQACHDVLLKLHIVYEIGALSGATKVPTTQEPGPTSILAVMDKRLAVVGSYISDKQYLLGIRRAVMRLSNIDFSSVSIGTSWLTTARLARKTNVSTIAHYAVLNAFSCGDDAAKIEHARLLWKDDQHRQAIQSLEGAIASDTFATYDQRMMDTSNPEEAQQKQNMLSARAHLLLAKWLDASGQTQATKVTVKYQYAARHYSRWEKGHYYLGKHYNMLLDAGKTLPVAKQSDHFISGELTKLVIENYLRSVPFGSKYWYQTIPKIITLWLDLGMECMQRTRSDGQAEVTAKRSHWLDAVHKQMRKYFDRIPPYIFYNALPQMISRITHPNPKVYEVLQMIISKIVSTHPSQALWFLLAVCKASVPDRASRGTAIISKLKDPKNRPKNESAGLDLRVMITHGQKLSDGLLQACEIHIETRSANVGLSKDLNFNHKLAPNPLVIPLESTLTANAPVVQDAFHIRKFVAFSQERITIQSFSDEVLVLNSLQRPRKLTVRGSDGKQYGLLCKPKDDLRKDQRLMEFNTMINRALKRDTESNKRRLYIKTYGVTPLSEESGTIEWVEGIKPLRDILLKLYQRKGVQPNYNELRVFLSEASANPANVDIFTDKVLKVFPSILHEWFTEMFPEPDSWFAARLRYARSAAVMSMVGHVLGLGDRHGENILLQEDTGGVFHVDFNCLFDKGLTFEKPELVPFRLTHNMIAAMGAYGYEGPFRKSAELTLGLLRQHQDTLMNILETFLHDPTTDFIGKKKRTTPGVPDTPQEVLDSISSKLKGFLRGETIPLSVEGHVNALIGQATDPWNLCQMYIGWCAFL
ncbi:hypothetical protein AUEXF2481DRAFT_78310 [Aureobasidium subglaciale EXF-2481]|uniref:Serine/threonine-protein kinase MEC1 n=1 Tax=Aureobasidium subglaciale (strain EXF-2481) TaxID=1043005 RepID=A0A074YIB7_AURSE|nr:uncharacterized protein AUEXF2481DRAFT_78310 [Aureobasidium subglaciale EXF-2481]KAI5198982.1 hypothetical protein E4T38_07242 [Aureobasidium subglaciale]KAI5217818.1 hypothetical protein E4T40_07253 [Aureobasidium subglaciale]KAI5220664.1 hypothetical protein E4T41_07407 [Aureobasidium subglaciale]KAI5258359.1 hypothetical protein E4T46_07384 [Aureobasidium subglaciale]KEQ97553.1 hypothetical protein AUEXF2481DRAFT_78310 [Aureobasidium subglaciale EXF-2481]